MYRIGFSTGALAKGDIARGIEMSRELNLTIIELSALRLRELETLVRVAAEQDLTDFEYISVHAPTDFRAEHEIAVAAALRGIAQERNWPVIVHPDTIRNFDQWRPLKALLYVENMDKRKPQGRTLEELRQLLELLPESKICFDIAHARQVDSSMTEAYRILREFRREIRQIHFSEVTSDSRHRHVSESGFRAYSKVAPSLPYEVPVILETIVAGSAAPEVDALSEIEQVRQFLTQSARLQEAAR